MKNYSYSLFFEMCFDNKRKEQILSFLHLTIFKCDFLHRYKFV